MRKTLVALLVIGVVWIAYTAWPVYELLVLVRAIEARDLSTVVRHVRFDRIRLSLTEQLVTAYIRKSGIKLNPFAQQAASAGLSAFNPVVTKLVSPEALSELLAVGWPVTIAGNPPPGIVGINREALGTAWQIFSGSQYGIGRFEVSAPAELSPPNRFRLTFQLLAWRWQLTGILLPEKIQDLLADEVIKAAQSR